MPSAATSLGSPPTAVIPRAALSRARHHRPSGACRRRLLWRRSLRLVEAAVERDGKSSIARRYCLSSLPLDAATFVGAIRSHWGIENRLHWVFDVIFRDDQARLRTGHGPENMAVVKHMAVNLVRQATPATSLKNRRKLAAWSTNYLEALLRQTA